MPGFPEPPATANPTGMDGSQYQNGQPDFIIKKKRNNAYASNTGFNKKRGYGGSSYGARAGVRSQPPRFSDQTGQMVKKEVLFRGEADLGDGLYHVEINQTVTNDLIIQA